VAEADLQKELFELLVKAARRCAYDLGHAIDNIDNRDIASEFRERQRYWLTIFDPANGPKEYRHRLHIDLMRVSRELEDAIKLLDANGIKHDLIKPF